MKEKSTEEDLALQIGALLDFLKQGGETQKEVERAIWPLQREAAFLSKARGLSEKDLAQRHFGLKTRKEIIDEIRNLRDLHLIVVPEKDGSAAYRVEKVGMSHVPAPKTGVYLSCTYSNATGVSVYKGVFEFSKDWKHVTISFLDRNGTRHIQQGNVTEEDELIFIRAQSSGQDLLTPTLFVFFKLKGKSWHDTDFFRGIYATSNMINRPVCGEIILKKTKDMNAAQTLVGKEAEPRIQYLLRHKQIKTEKPIIVESDLDGLFNHEIDALSRWAGVYKGHYFEPYLEGYFIETRLTLSEDGTALLESHDINQQKGICYPIENGAIILFPYKNSSEDHLLWSSFLILKSASPGGKKGLEGVFSGFLNGTPFSRRIYLDLEARAKPPSTAALQCFSAQESKSRFSDLIDKLLGGSDKFLEDAFWFFPEEAREFIDVEEDYEDGDFDEPGEADLSSWAGVYECLVAHHLHDKRKDHLQKLVMGIDQKGEATLRSERREYKGRFRLAFKGNVLLGVFTRKEGGEEEFSFLIRSGFLGDEDNILHGIFAGVGNQVHEPFGGKIFCTKLKDGAEAKAKNIKLRSPEWEEFKLKQPDVIGFFLGESDDMIPSYEFFRRNRLVPRAKADKTALEKLAGDYLLFKLDSGCGHIKVNPLQITQDGTVKIKGNSRVEEYYSGVISIQKGSILTIQINWSGDSPYWVQSLYSIGNIDDAEKITFYSGISTAITGNNTPRCSREVLIRVEGTSFSAMEAELIPIPVNRISSPRFWEYNRKYHGALVFLVGEENNLIKAVSGPAKEIGRKLDYGDIFFSAACHHAGSPGGDPEKALQYLNRAKAHGFRDMDRLAAEMNGGCLQAIRHEIDPESFLREA